MAFSQFHNLFHFLRECIFKRLPSIKWPYFLPQSTIKRQKQYQKPGAFDTWPKLSYCLSIAVSFPTWLYITTEKASEKSWKGRNCLSKILCRLLVQIFRNCRQHWTIIKFQGPSLAVCVRTVSITCYHSDSTVHQELGSGVQEARETSGFGGKRET